MKRFLCFLLILLISLSCFASSLLESSLSFANETELRTMADAFGLDTTNLSADAMRTALSEHLDGFAIPVANVKESVSNKENGSKTGVSDAKLVISSCEEMSAKDNLVVLNGNVRIVFTPNGSESYTLDANRVVMNTDAKCLEACGDVLLFRGDSKEKFSGNVLTVNWESADLKVYDGTSSSKRQNASNSSIDFWTTGSTVSYAGGTDVVLFNDGIIGTREKNPYWSLKAKKFSLLGSDLFFENAVFRMGRVPLLWIPVFYYPNAKLGFNPAVGYSDERGNFINTTWEILGKYPALSGMDSSSGSDDNLAGNFLSFLDDKDSGDYIRKGLLYEKVNDQSNVSKAEQWARKSGSYVAVTSDIYEKTGIALGYDSLVNVQDRNFKFKSRGVLAYDMLSSFRGAVDVESSLSLDKVKFSFSADPLFISDPLVKSDYYNRNTVFAFDSIFGSNQNFPSSYSTVYSFTQNLSSSLSFSGKNVNFAVNDLKAEVVNEWSNSEKKYKVTSAVLPAANISLTGTLVSYTGKKPESKKEARYLSPLAREFEKTLNEFKSEEPESVSFSEDVPAAMQAASVEKKSSADLSASSFKATYSLNEILNNSFDSGMNPKTFSSKFTGSVVLSGKTPGNWFSFTDTVKSSADLNLNTALEKANNDSDIKISNSLTISSPVLGLSYSLSNLVFSEEIRAGNVNSKKTGDWHSSSDTAHSISFAKTAGPFSFGLSSVLKPSDGFLPAFEDFVPSVTFASNGFRFSSSFRFDTLHEESFKADTAQLGLSYSNSVVSFDISGSFAYLYQMFESFETYSWKDFTAVQNFSFVFPYLSSVKISESFTLKEKGVPYSLSASLDFPYGNISFSWLTSDDFTVLLQKDKLGVNLSYRTRDLYFWKNRIGLNSYMNASFAYDFRNKYGSSLSFSMGLDFAVLDLFGLSFNIVSSNNSFYRYYENDRFSFPLIMKDLLNSFDVIGGKNRNTGFNMSSYTLTLVHYMQDWDLYVDGNAKVGTNSQGKNEWQHEFSVYVKWRAIPELKVEKRFEEE